MTPNFLMPEIAAAIFIAAIILEGRKIRCGPPNEVQVFRFLGESH